jgi:hypothetical protein
MVRRGLLGSAAVLAAIVLAGCGGGGGSSASGSSRQAVAKQHAIATARLNRATLAVAGLARHVTRAPRPRLGARFAILQQALVSASRSRRAASPSGPAVSQGFDADTGLYYTLTINPDGSGREDLFLDVARKVPAGSFTWGVPQWHNGQPNSYPAVLHVFYQITAGNFAGVHGEMYVTLNDANDTKGLIHVLLDNAHHEHCDATFDVGADLSSGSDNSGTDNVVIVSGTDNVTLGDGTTYTETDASQSNGDLTCAITFPDGSTETMNVQPDGAATQTVTDPGGSVDTSGNLQSNGNDTINSSDGSSETVNVDAGNADSSSGDSSGSSSGDSSGGSSGDSSGGSSGG